MKLTKREQRCLERIQAGKSIVDTKALDYLEAKGVVRIAGEDGECRIEVMSPMRTSGQEKSDVHQRFD